MEPVPLAPGSCSLNPWTKVLCHFMEGTWTCKDSVLNAFPWSFFGAEASNLFPQKKLIFFMLSVQPLKGLGFKIRHTGGQACLYSWAPRTLWTPKAGWASRLSVLCVYRHTPSLRLVNTVHTAERVTESHLLTTLLGPDLCSSSFGWL